MANQASGMRFAGQTLVQMNPRKYPDARHKANGYLCPLGPQPGIGYVLVTRGTWNIINNAGRNNAYSLELTSSGTVTFPGLYIVNAMKVSGGWTGDPNAVYMLKLTDKRWHARMSDVAIQVNVRCPAPPATSGASLYYADSLDSGSVYTWARACQVLWEEIPNFGAFPGLPHTPDGNPEGFQFVGVSALDALSCVLQRIGCTINYNPLTTAVSIVQTGVVQAGLDLALALANRQSHLLDAEPFDVPAALAPQTIRVYFHKRDKNYGTEHNTQRTTGTWVTESWHSEDVPTNVAGAVTGTVVSLWDDLPATCDFDGTVNNTSALATRAAERAADYLGDITIGSARRRTVYQGVVAGILPGSQIKYVHWRNFGAEAPVTGGLVTEIGNCPGLVRMSDTSSGLTAIDCEASAVGEALMPADLARPTYPIYPPHLQIVRVAGSGGGTVSSEGSSGLFTGKVLRADATGNYAASTPYSDGEDCWLAMTNPLTGSQAGGTLFAGDRYLAKLNGSATVSGSTRPLYVLLRPENQTFHFTAGSTVGDGGSISITLSDGRSISATARGDITSGDSGIAWRDMGDSTWNAMVPGSGGGGGTTFKIYYSHLFTNCAANDPTTFVGNLTSFLTGVADVAGPIEVTNLFGEVGVALTECLVFQSTVTGEYILARAFRNEETLECYVYQPFNRQTARFEAKVLRSYQGDRVGESVIVENQADPFDVENPYLFEGEFQAICRVQYDPLTDLWRVVWVECPEETPEVSPGEQSQQISLLTMMDGAYVSNAAIL
ncbi:MAG: hypothetical protein AB7I37_25270 [Pirellulales bacterium]